MNYGIVGSGKAVSRIVKDGLADILSADKDPLFFIHARRNPQGAVIDVYDFLADNECNFFAYHRVDDNPPKGLVNLAQGSAVTEDPLKEIITKLKSLNGTLLLLWDEETPESSENIALMASEAGVSIKDLSNGLTPIVVEESPTVVEKSPLTPERERALTEALNGIEKYYRNGMPLISPFTRDELMNMNYGVLRRQAKAQGIENIPNTKEGIVALLLGETVVAEDKPSQAHPVIVWYADGQLITKSVNYEEIKHLLS